MPSSTLVCEGFLGLAGAASIGLGFPDMPVARVIGHPGVQSRETLRKNTLDVTLDHVIANLLQAPAESKSGGEPGPREVIATGTFDEINEHFYANALSDGLPIVPPTVGRVEQFLRYTDRASDESLGTLLPDSRAATVWSIAVNGVMAGCRPEYMPVLIALVEAMADPAYGVEHSGNTPGGETLIILNGPVIQALGFNYTQGVMRDGFRANTSIGRFWRLYLRNVAGFLPHKNDKATFGNTWRVVVAENEEVVRKIGWTPNSVDMGFNAGDNT
ncbi:MAG TPA: UGSC family (seleno)protein, partial [Burkholderiales bacterium]|nr:UGSC family (seleno)protein [Burkholderiales bacterium]